MKSRHSQAQARNMESEQLSIMERRICIAAVQIVLALFIKEY